MGKKLSEMTLEELWQLFPIFLTAHQPAWKAWYCEEERLLSEVLPSLTRISHIGSTAIPSIWAKPIIDILAEIPKGSSLADCKALICKAGYICMSQGENRLSFNKGYTEQGFAERVFHLHLRIAGDHDELYFRDYLIEFPEIAKEYETMKLALWKVHEHDRDAYTNEKLRLSNAIRKPQKSDTAADTKLSIERFDKTECLTGLPFNGGKLIIILC